jgi:bifunctional non-homologous end joining protein LigD
LREDAGNAKSDGAKIGKAKAASPSGTSSDIDAALEDLPGAKRAPMPTAIYPMLATAIEEPFDSPDWLFEIKWDGYRAIAFIEKRGLRLVSRNQNDLTAQYPDLSDLPDAVNAKTVILDGEIVVLDEHGRASFSLMQQRTGFRERGRRAAPRPDVPVLYYVFDLLYLDGYDVRRVALEDRKRLLASIITENDSLRLSGHFAENGEALFEVAWQKGLEGILAKRRGSYYEERRSREWLKIKIRHQLEAVVGGYTEPEGSRQYFGSIVLGLYDKEGNLVHVGQAGSGFTQMTLASVWKLLKPLETKTNPFHGKVEALKKVHWVKPELVAQIEFTEWTHATDEGGPKLRAPVFLGLREDKDPSECVLEQEA